jgi:hypothetical protein
MPVTARTASLILFGSCLSATGCLVSFQDFPVSDLGASGGGGSGDIDTGGVAATSAAGSLDAAGYPAGGTSSGGTRSSDDGASGGMLAGGAPAGGMPASGMSSGGSDGGMPAAGAAMGGAAAGGAAGGMPSGGAPNGGMSSGGTAGGAVATGGGGAGGATVSSPLIDDFEDGNAQILLNAGRDGSWFTSNDGTGQQTPPANSPLPSTLTPARGTSTRAMHTTGMNFRTWGAIVGANFVQTGATVALYNASAYQGVTFTAKMGKFGTAAPLRVSIPDYDTVVGCTSCGDPFGASVTLTTNFQTFQVPFSSFKQAGFGQHFNAFDPTRTYSINFSWGANQTFDVWIDDLSFY